jgi:flagellar biosynthesis protein FlhF
LKVKTYRAPTLAEALAEVKNDLGREAVIVQTRRLRQGGFLGMMATEIVEVTAAVDTALAKANKAAAARPPEPKPKENGADDAKMLALHLELASMRKSLESVLEGRATAQKTTAETQPEKKKSFLQEWARKNDLDPVAADALFYGIPNINSLSSELFQSRLRERLIAHFQDVAGITVRPAYCKVVALIGPTGVGKTTTVAKLAANFALKEKFRVALVTADTYRIAAVEQLKTYADLIGIPIDVVYTPQEMRSALYRHQDKQLVLIDTAGRSPSNQPQLAELEALLAVDDNIEKHLVLSATTKFTDCLEAVQRFQPSKPQKYLFTKLDEASNLGTLFNLMFHAPKTLSYITTGQNVPDDIELADPNRLTTLMLRGKS